MTRSGRLKVVEVQKWPDAVVVVAAASFVVGGDQVVFQASIP
jgi:hypothetical protein